MTERSAQPTRRQLQQFGLLVGVGVPLLMGWLLPAMHGHPFRAWTLWVGIPALAASLVAPFALFWPYRGWMALGRALGWVNSYVILGTVFLLVLQPIAYIMRLGGYDPLRRRADARLVSYREQRTQYSISLNRIF